MGLIGVGYIGSLTLVCSSVSPMVRYSPLVRQSDALLSVTVTLQSHRRNLFQILKIPKSPQNPSSSWPSYCVPAHPGSKSATKTYRGKNFSMSKFFANFAECADFITNRRLSVFIGIYPKNCLQVDGNLRWEDKLKFGVHRGTYCFPIDTDEHRQSASVGPQSYITYLTMNWCWRTGVSSIIINWNCTIYHRHAKHCIHGTSSSR